MNLRISLLVADIQAQALMRQVMERHTENFAPPQQNQQAQPAPQAGGQNANQPTTAQPQPLPPNNLGG